ncbi:MAG: hypothetical protein VB024_07670 [Dysgonamonadaceae bacterium]|jgi:hypothetical protein|nr:hypothetical protein [Dysgonamonadaceae bacterium]MDD3309293.1 hypothetical protein [Dysgonamonadaceae bacterium]MDD3900639.1 hypothetical protein [Dysgonamonadaceae bacterium]MDD4399099.1 hypothetical protein [Dysgonamonadaceae bacterium]MEA5081480.1 hypothetical protein [Dysgonamonadaceae bacterium]
MEYVVKFLKKYEDDADVKNRKKVLSFFTSQSDGKSLTMITNALLRTSKTEKITFTILQMISPKEAEFIDNIDEYKNMLFKDLTSICEKENTIARSFVNISNDFTSDILKLSEQYESELIVIELSSGDLDFTVNENLYLSPKNETQKYPLSNVANPWIKNVSELLLRNDNATALFIDRGIKLIKKVFVFILDISDISILRYAHHFPLNENTTLLIWDAIGLIANVPELQKLYTSMNKRTDGRVEMWNIDQKITEEVIQQHDLIITGIEGWDKLMHTSITWNKSLPTTLIIKDELN